MVGFICRKHERSGLPYSLASSQVMDLSISPYLQLAIPGQLGTSWTDPGQDRHGPRLRSSLLSTGAGTHLSDVEVYRRSIIIACPDHRDLVCQNQFRVGRDRSGLRHLRASTHVACASAPGQERVHDAGYSVFKVEGFCEALHTYRQREVPKSVMTMKEIFQSGSLAIEFSV